MRILIIAILLLVIVPTVLLAISVNLARKAKQAGKGKMRDALIWCIVSSWAFLFLYASLTWWVLPVNQTAFVTPLVLALFVLTQIRLAQVIEGEKQKETTQQKPEPDLK